MRYNTIVVGIDFSEPSDTALAAAAELAVPFSASLHIVPGFAFPIPAMGVYGVSLPDGYFESVQAAAQTRLEDAAKTVADEGLEVEWHLAEVPAAVGIVRVATETSADLIVVGTRGNTGLKHVILGSVAERVVRTAPCSVLTVKPRDE